jgi:hypothetical protein
MTEGIRSRGDWSELVQYFVNDVVAYGGNTFICTSVHASGVFATDLGANKWQKFSGGINWRDQWTAATFYRVNDVVRSGGSAYLAIQDHESSGTFTADVDLWQLFAVGAGDVFPPINALLDLGKSLTVKADGSGFELAAATLSAHRLYVAVNGIDTPGRGTNQAAPLASLKYACSLAIAGTTIFVASGNYLEQLPITVPAGVAIVGDTQRTTIIGPKEGNDDTGLVPNFESSMFLLGNGALLNKMTFKGLTGWVPGAEAKDITTSVIKAVYVRFDPAVPVTTKSPYVIECSSIGSGGIGALVDGSVHDTGYRTIIFHAYTVIQDNGVGIWCKDAGKSEIVSCFTYYCYFGYSCSGGGSIRALNGNNSYGTWGVFARGFDEAEPPITGTLVGQQLNFLYGGGSIVVGDTVSNSSGGSAVVTNAQFSANKLYVKDVTGTFTQGDELTFTSGGQGTVAQGALEGQQGFLLMATGFSEVPKPGVSLQLSDDTYSYVIQSVSGTYVDSLSVLALVLAQEKPTGSADGAGVTLRYHYSQIRLTGHDFLSIGTGGFVTTNYPGRPTQPAAQGNETEEVFPGRCYYVSTDQDGNFRVGEYFRIDQATGRATLNASAFDLSGLTSLKLGSIGAQLGETINEFSSDVTLSGNSNLAIPTEAAVKGYVDTKTDSVGASLNKILGASTIFVNPTQTVPTQPYRVSLVSGSGNLSWSLTGAPAGVSVTANGYTATLSSSSSVTAGTYAMTLTVSSGNVTVSLPISLVSSAAFPYFSSAVAPTAVSPAVAFSSAFAQASPTGTTHVITDGALPTWATLGSNGLITGTAPAESTTTVTFSFTVTATNGSFVTSKSFTWAHVYFQTQGQTLFGTNVGTGTFSWVCPTEVTSVSAVAVGGGGNGPKIYNSSASGGGGGGLGWKNNIPVVAGTTYTVVVGAGGTSHSFGNLGLRGGNSYFISLGVVCGYGGGHRSVTGTGGPNANGATGGGWVGDGGGAGGDSTNAYNAGSGAGGYAGNGGGSNQNGNGGGGAGGGIYSSTYGYSSGGGVGLLGQGNSGIKGLSPWQTSGQDHGAGGPGSWNGPGSGNWTWGMTRGNPAIGQGDRGMYGENPWSSSGEDGNGGLTGGAYGGGGGGQGDSWTSSGGKGGQGGVRIIWGAGRSFPLTLTTNQTVRAI